MGRERHRRRGAPGSCGGRPRGGRLNLRAQNLHIFLQIGDGLDAATWLHHLRRGDYSAWVRKAIKDERLAGEIAAVEAAAIGHQGTAEALADDTRRRVRTAVESQYAAPA